MTVIVTLYLLYGGCCSIDVQKMCFRQWWRINTWYRVFMYITYYYKTLLFKKINVLSKFLSTCHTQCEHCYKMFAFMLSFRTFIWLYISKYMLIQIVTIIYLYMSMTSNGTIPFNRFSIRSIIFLNKTRNLGIYVPIFFAVYKFFT